MTRAEFYEKYGNVEVKFESYYKYTFTFSAILPNGDCLNCDVGGDRDSIYRQEVASNTIELVNSLCPFAGRVYRAMRKLNHSMIIEETYAYR